MTPPAAITRPRRGSEKCAEAYMRASGTAIRELPIAERMPPQSGSITGRTVAKDEAHIAVAIGCEPLCRQ